MTHGPGYRASRAPDMEAAAPTERDKLIIRVLADTGMRVGELADCGRTQ